MAIGDKDGVVMQSDRAVAGGIATLGTDGKLLDAQIPSLAKLGAAPAGFGLGNASGKDISGVDPNTVVKNGWYSIDGGHKNYPETLGYSYMFVAARNDSNVTQFLLESNNAGHIGVIHKRVLFGGTWGEWERVNPPMHLGVEYRTTERYNGKPVYVKLHTGFALPVNGERNVAALAAECRIFEIRGFNVETGCAFPSENFNDVVGQSVTINTHTSGCRFRIRTNFDASACVTNYVFTKYYKTTD